MSTPGSNFAEIWDEVNRSDFVSAVPTNEHDRHSVRGMFDLMREIEEAIRNAKQVGMNPARTGGFERELKQMREFFAEECKIARRIDPKVPIVRRRGQRWEAYQPGANEQPT